MSTTTSQSSSVMHSTDESSVTSHSDSYTTASYSTLDPPSHLNIKVNHSSVSGMSDPSASSASHYHSSTTPTVSRPVFSPVLEETTSALDAASSQDRPSVDADGSSGNVSGNSNNSPPTPSAVAAAMACGQPFLPLECDYDKAPTELYRAIEDKQWTALFELFRDYPIQAKHQAATWVARKEASGKLRWKLLPVHAAVIFQAPAVVIEKLLQECPEAAQAKDDQSMLPLHLVFRTKTTCWETMEVLMTIYPHALFVKDRKGRTPLECGVASASAAAEAEVVPPTTSPSGSSFIKGLVSPKRAPAVTPQVISGGGAAMTPAQQKAMLSVMELYTQASVQDQLQSAMNNSQQALEARIGIVQDNHVATLTQLKKGWENQRNDLQRKVQGHRKEVQNLKQDFNIQQEMLEEKVKTEMELVDQLQQVTTALEHKTIMDDGVVDIVARDISSMQCQDLQEANKKVNVLKTTNKELLLLLETLLDEQNALKTSLDKLSWDTKAKDSERKDVLNKYFVVQEQATEMSESYTKEWQKRLEETSMNVSEKLGSILSQNQMGTTTNPAEAYDGEEKKEAHAQES